MNRRTVWIVCIVVIMLGLMSMAYRLMMPENFDLVKWQQADEPAEYRDRRAMMPGVDRMFADGTINSRQTALRYLGKPQRGDINTSRSWFYSLGGQRSAESAPEQTTWLVLIFDSAGNLVKHHTVQEETDSVQTTG